jgi:hypothetical protein
MQSVAETPIFTRQTEKLFTEDEKRELIDFHGNRWQEMKSRERVGCARFALRHPDAGKRGGARIIYYYLDETMPLYALLAMRRTIRAT